MWLITFPPNKNATIFRLTGPSKLVTSVILSFVEQVNYYWTTAVFNWPTDWSDRRQTPLERR